jgi:RNA polymerase sigma-70 factor (ECF subfamily)
MDAEEVMHDVFLKLFDRLDELQDEKAFHAWSRSIAVRTSIDKVRKQKLIFEQIDDNMSIADEENDASTSLSNRFKQLELSVETIKREMNNLPGGYRIILSMRLFEECEFSEIAQMLQIKESTVRSQFARGRMKLVETLKQKMIDK